MGLGGERFSYHLEPEGGGTLLTFVHVFADRDRGADCASGWHCHLDRLAAHLDGRPVPDADAATLSALNDYADRLGLDPEVGRRSIAEYFGTQER